MENTEIKDPLFREAVEAIDAGNMILLESLITKHPELVSKPLDRPSGDYFQNPYLLWFVADNPIRTERLPANIVDITRLLIHFVKQEAASTAQQQLDYALGLVATGRIPRDCGVQISLVDLLIDAGAKPGGGLGALAHGNIAAAERLIERGGKLTLAAAVGLNRMEDVVRLLPDADDNEKLTALTVAAYYGNSQMLLFLLNAGVNPNGYPVKQSGFHSHTTPLHQAVQSGSLESVKLLVEAGADINARDKMWDGTPLDWAQYMPREEGCDEAAKQRFADIESYLRNLEKI